MSHTVEDDYIELDWAGNCVAIWSADQDPDWLVELAWAAGKSGRSVERVSLAEACERHKIWIDTLIAFGRF